MVEFNKKILENGFTILHEKREIPVTTIMLGTRYGSRHEEEFEKGIAHFIEHMCFKGTETRTTKEIAEEIESIGGILNAFTAEEVTTYYAKIPSDHLKKVAKVLFDIFYNPLFPEEEMKKEVEVICEEIKMYEDNPRSKTLLKIGESLYEKPFGMFATGIPETLRKMTRKQLLEKHRKRYTPKNSVLVVVGNNSFEEVLNIAKEFNIDREYQEVIKPKIIKKIEQKREKQPTLQQTNLAIGFHFPNGTEKEKYAAEIFSSILGEGMSSRLFSEVREKRGLVYGIKTDLEKGKDYGSFIIWAGTDPSKEEEVKNVALSEFKKMANLTSEELEKGIIKILGIHKIEAESSDDVARDLLISWAEGNVEEFYEYENKIKKVKLEEIKELAKKTEYSFFSLGP